MDTGTHSDDEHTPPSSPEDPTYMSFGGGMFAGSQNFTIGAGTFNNVNHYHAAPFGPPDFRMIPMGDIDLQRELVVNGESGVIDRQLGSERRCVRRVYSARIDGRNTDLTVAMYEGDGAEEAWQQHVKIYMSLRHPNILQMHGAARSDAMYATIFHGDLIPFRQFMAWASPIITVYIDACYVTEWRARDYVEKSPYFCKSSHVGLEIYSTLWIRRSNGRLCVDFDPHPDGKNEGNDTFYNSYPGEYRPPVNPSLNPTSQEAVAIHSFTLGEYHRICSYSLRQLRSSSFFSFATISSGAVFLCPPNGQPHEGAEILSLSLGAEFFSWDWHLGEERLSGMLMKNNWTRFNTNDVSNDTLTYTVDFDNLSDAWLIQANCIFSRLQTTSHLEDYFLVHQVEFEITVGTVSEDAPPSYLFLCPTTNFQTGPLSFSWPDCPAYWSLDPSGLDRLTAEETTQLGFPSLRLTTQVHGYFWDTSVYAGLRQFHQAKGFDPESQDVARHMGYPLYQLSRKVNAAFAHVGELSEDDEDCFDDGTGNSNLEASDYNNVQVEACARLQHASCDGRSVSSVQPMEPTPHSADLPANSEPQILNDRGTGGNFIHRFFWGLQQGIETKIENVDTDAISPFLV
ncbi:hypothetical protein C8F04DRAFT_530346 [Mycena alexandri]|uniref:Protein kinase domain-containing protein n=1 Tax=Mycena alexandri TaxID=1745969 RepID=A0AAD6SX58_9AGAR|nr:hypothetical protein C8F04DRAFT_530346 [Mycena alexandri]